MHITQFVLCAHTGLKWSFHSPLSRWTWTLTIFLPALSLASNCTSCECDGIIHSPPLIREYKSNPLGHLTSAQGPLLRRRREGENLWYIFDVFTVFCCFLCNVPFFFSFWKNWYVEVQCCELWWTRYAFIIGRPVFLHITAGLKRIMI